MAVAGQREAASRLLHRHAGQRGGRHKGGDQNGGTGGEHQPRGRVILPQLPRVVLILIIHIMGNNRAPHLLYVHIFVFYIVYNYNILCLFPSVD